LWSELNFERAYHKADSRTVDKDHDLKFERAYRQGVSALAKGLLLAGGSGVDMLGLPLGPLSCWRYPFLQAIAVHLMHTLIKWAAWYNACLLITLTPKGIVFFFSFLHSSRL